MISGSVPLLTKGPFALFPGVEEMLEVLDDGNPGNALPYLILYSILFQICVFSFKTIQYSATWVVNRLCSKSAEISGWKCTVLQCYYFNVYIQVSIQCQRFYFKNYHSSHYMQIEENKKKTEIDTIATPFIFLQLFVFFFCTVLTFFRSQALRQVI